MEVDARRVTVFFLDAKPAGELNVVGRVSLIVHLDAGVTALVYDTPRSVAAIATKAPNDPIIIGLQPAHARARQTFIVWWFRI